MIAIQGKLVVYEDTVRMLWLPIHIVSWKPNFKHPKPDLEFLRR
jgi:hypothetical protein